MKPEPKLRGGTDSELTKFKRLWRDTLPAASREYWLSVFESEATQPQIRAEIKAKTDINLLYDRQLTEFRQWEFEQRLRETESEQMRLDQEQMQREFPEMTMDQVREEVLKKSYARGIATGNYKQVLATVDRDQAERFGKTKAEIERSKISLAERRVKLLEENARAAKAQLESIVKNTGGLSPQTLKEIEEAAKLL